MNFVTAMSAGASKVDCRGRGRMIYRGVDGSLQACAVGAAYLGCHPHINPRGLSRSELFELNTAISRWVDSHRLEDQLVHIEGINDQNPGGWPEITEAIERVWPSNAELCDA